MLIARAAIINHVCPAFLHAIPYIVQSNNICESIQPISGHRITILLAYGSTAQVVITWDVRNTPLEI